MSSRPRLATVVHRIDDLEKRRSVTYMNDRVVHRIDDLEKKRVNILMEEFVVHRIDDLETLI